jgi:acyl-coenzyme A thioesterase PaaI-like protein
MRHPMNLLPVYKASFFLNQRREDGLKLKVVYAGDHVYTDFRIDDRFRNETDSVYNGIVFAIMDVLMWYAIMMETKKICVTRKTDMEFIEPVSCNIPYRAKSRLLSHDQRDIHVSAWVEDENGRVCTKVTALFREGKGANIAEIIKDFDFSETTPEMKELFYSFIE